MESGWCGGNIILLNISLDPLFGHHSSSTILHDEVLLLFSLYLFPILHECYRDAWYAHTFSFHLS